jgi:plastocyanin
MIRITIPFFFLLLSIFGYIGYMGTGSNAQESGVVITINPGATNSQSQNPISPANATVTAGSNVTWLNRDSTPHLIVSGTPESGPSNVFYGDYFETGKTYNVTFDQVGIYDYYDPSSQKIKGQVIVVAQEENNTQTPFGSESSNTFTNNNTISSSNSNILSNATAGTINEPTSTGNFLNSKTATGKSETTDINSLIGGGNAVPFSSPSPLSPTTPGQSFETTISNESLASVNNGPPPSNQSTQSSISNSSNGNRDLTTTNESAITQPITQGFNQSIQLSPDGILQTNTANGSNLSPFTIEKSTSTIPAEQQLPTPTPTQSQEPDQRSVMIPPHEATDSFVAEGLIDSTIITETSSWNATGDWKMVVEGGNVENFTTNMAWYNGTSGHTHEFLNFESTDEIELPPDNIATIDGKMDVGTNGKVTWDRVDSTISIGGGGKTITISVDHGDTDHHFAGQPISGSVTSLFICSDRPGSSMEVLPTCG